MTARAAIAAACLAALAASAGPASADTVRGTSHRDLIVSTPEPDRLLAGAGPDLVIAGPGDRADCGAGRDRLVLSMGRRYQPAARAAARRCETVSSQPVALAAAGLRLAAPVLRWDGRTLAWNKVNGTRKYVIAATPGGDRSATAYAAVTGLSWRPAAQPGATVAYAVRSDQAGAPWSPETAVTWPDSGNGGAGSGGGGGGGLPVPASAKIFGLNNITGWGPGMAEKVRAALPGVTHERQEYSPGMAWAYIDQRLRDAYDHGVQVEPLLNQYGSPMGQPLSALNRSAFAAWTGQFTARYGPGGSFWASRADKALAPGTFEIENEPYGQWYFTPVEPFEYARWFYAAARAGRAANPAAKFLIAVGPDRSTGILDSASAAWCQAQRHNGWCSGIDLLFAGQPGLAAEIDGIAIHPYGNPCLQDAGGPVRCPAGFSGPPGEDWGYAFTRKARAELLAHGVNKPFWITEVGATTGPGGASGAVTEAQQAAQAKFITADAKAQPWIKALIWYCLRDYGDGTDREHNFGILRRDNTWKPAAAAYQQAIAAP